jgi:hypothetical protein
MIGEVPDVLAHARDVLVTKPDGSMTTVQEWLDELEALMTAVAAAAGLGEGERA